MPGTILLDDLHASIEDQLHQHVNDLLKQAQQVGQQAQQVIQPVQAAAGLAQMPAQIQAPDAGQVQQALLQHVDNITQAAQQAAQPAVQVLGGGAQAAGGALSTLGGNADQVRQSLLDHVDSITQPVQSGLQSLAVPKAPEPTPALGGLSDQAISAPALGGPPVAAPTPSAAPADRSMSYQDYAKAAAQRAGIDPNVFTAQIQQESGFNPTARSPAGAIGIAQFMPETAKSVGVDPTDPYAALDAAAAEDAKRLQQYGGDWGKTLASYNAGSGAVAQYGGIPPYAETQSYVKTIMGNAQRAADAAGTAISNVVTTGKQVAGQAVELGKQAVRDISQFGDSQLTSSEAYAACGPAAAVRFAERFGRNPTLREATDLAKQVGWTEQGGMAGLQSEQKLMTNLGIDTRTVGRDWSAFAKEAATGNPVTISTPGHYYYADGYNAESGAFHVGRSGLDLKGGSEWMTPAQMENLMGTAQGALFSNNPNVPAKGSTTTSNESVALGGGGGTQNAPLGPPPAQPVKQPLYVHGAMQDAQGNEIAQGPTPIQTAQDVLGGAAGAVGGAVGQVASDLGSAAQGALGAAQQVIQPAARAVEQANEYQPGTEALPVVQQAAQQAVQAATPVLGGVQQAVQGAAPVLGGVDQIRQKVQDTIDNLPSNASVAQVRSAIGDTLETLGPRALKVAGDLPLPMGGTVSDLEAPARTAQELAGQVQVPETGNLAAKAAGTGLSALGTVAKAATDELDRLSIASTAAREAAGEDVYGQKYATAGGPRLEDEYRQLLTQRMGGDNSVSPRMTEIADQLQQINTTIRAGRPQSEVNQALSAENPLTPVSTTLTNLGAAVLAAPLAAGEAPLVARALAEILQPGTNPLQIAQALRIVNDTHVTAPALVDAIDQVRKMPGTAELAPVRAQVTQSSTDLLQAMLDAARAKGADSDKLTAFEQQIAAMDPTAATRRALTPVTAETGGFTAPGGPLSAVRDVPAATRMFHGTGSDFAKVDPEWLDTTRGRFGTGYYLTENPEAASAHATSVVGDPGWQPNVRPVDVPSDLKLFDMDATGAAAEAQAARAREGLSPTEQTHFDLISGGKTDPQTVWTAVKAASVTNDPNGAAELLAQSGFDGVKDVSTHRDPVLRPDTGERLPYSTVGIFPESLDKVRNAISGTQGGQVSARFATTLGGGVAGGVAGNASTPEDAGPLERGARIAGGAALGAGAGAALGSAAAGVTAGDVTRQLARVAGAPGGAVSRLGELVASALSPAENLPADTRGVLKDFANMVGRQSDAARVMAENQMRTAGARLDIPAVADEVQQIRGELREQAAQKLVADLQAQGKAAPIGNAPREFRTVADDPNTYLANYAFSPDVVGPIKAVVDISQIAGNPLGSAVLKTIGTAKGTLFSLSNFHTLTEGLNAAFTSPQTLGNYARAFGSNSFAQGLRASMADTIDAAARAGVTGLAEHARPEDVGTQIGNAAWRRVVAGGVSGAGGAAAGYTETKLTGGTEEEARANAAKGGLAGLALAGVPLGKRGTVPEILQSALWDRAVPLAKATAWDALQKGGLDAKQAATVVNERFGGLNYAAMGRNPTLLDAQRLLLQASDWNEATVRQLGSAMFGGDGRGVRAGFLAKTIAGMMTTTEVANYALSGHSTLDNQPGHQFEVEVQNPNGGYLHFGILPGNVQAYLNLANTEVSDPTKRATQPTNFVVNRLSAPVGAGIDVALSAAGRPPFQIAKAGPIALGENVAPIGVSQVLQSTLQGGMNPLVAGGLAAVGLNPRYSRGGGGGGGGFTSPDTRAPLPSRSSGDAQSGERAPVPKR